MARDLPEAYQGLLLRAFDTLGAKTGDAFFESVTRCVAEGVRADVALIGALDGDGRAVRSLAIWRDGALSEPMRYALAGTPCETLLSNGPCVISEDLQARFPEDAFIAELGMRSYAGAPIHDGAGAPLGLISLMSRGVFENSAMIPTLLSAFAARAAAELAHAETERRLRAANVALQEALDRRSVAETRFRDIARISSDWFWETDAQHRFTYISTASRESTGVAPEEHIGRTRAEILEDRVVGRDDAAWAELERKMEAREPFRDFAYLYHAPTGALRWLRIGGAPVFDAHGAFIGYRGVASDITDLREAEDRAHAMEQRLRDGIEAMQAGFALFDAEDRLVLCNSAYGRDAGLIAGMPIRQGASFEEILRRTVESGRITDPLALEDPEAFIARRMTRHARPDGLPIEQALAGPRWVEIRERRTVDGGVVVVRADVTARKRSELRLLDAIESIPVGFILCDRDDRVALFNRRYRELYPEFGDALRLGTSFEALCGICAEEIDPQGRDAGREQWISERLKRHREPGPPFQAQTRSGRSLLVSESRTSDGGHIGVHADITPLVLMQHELERAKQKLEAALAVRSRFLATMSHELRTPLNAILGFSELMLQQAKGPLPDAYVEYAQIIQSSGEFLLSLIVDILDISKMEAGRMRIEREPLALGPLIDEAAAMLSEKARAKGLALRAEVEPDLPEILGDRRRILQILNNLLSNAIKFTSQGAVSVSARREGDMAALRVRDSGRGMTPEEVAEALVPFQQARSLSSKEYLEGSGLGLPIVKALVELHEGALEIDSAPGSGTTVIVRLPLAFSSGRGA